MLQGPLWVTQSKQYYLHNDCIYGNVNVLRNIVWLPVFYTSLSSSPCISLFSFPLLLQHHLHRQCKFSGCQHYHNWSEKTFHKEWDYTHTKEHNCFLLMCNDSFHVWVAMFSETKYTIQPLVGDLNFLPNLINIDFVWVCVGVFSLLRDGDCRGCYNEWRLQEDVMILYLTDGHFYPSGGTDVWIL